MENKISVVIVGVLDMERAVNFYRDVLGLPLKLQTDSYTEFETQGAVLALEKRDQVLATGPAFTVTTQDAKEDFENSKRLGVEFWKPLHKESFGLVFMPKDTEGNIFEVVEYMD